MQKMLTRVRSCAWDPHNISRSHSINKTQREKGIKRRDGELSDEGRGFRLADAEIMIRKTCDASAVPV